MTNQAFAIHAWNLPGVYSVRLTGYNQDHPAGVSATVRVTVHAGVTYVDAAITNPVFPYQSWATAARTIAEAIGAGTLPSRLVLVTNGVYRMGQAETNGLNRIALTNLVVVRSVNGPAVTVIEGGTNTMRCAYVGNGSVLDGFTLTKGTAGGGRGGGVWSEPGGVVTNCVLTGNSALAGGGAFSGALYRCTFTHNSAQAGGGASEATLYNCTLTDNVGSYNGGGAVDSKLYNCVLSGNSAYAYGGGAYESTLNINNCTITGNSADNGTGGGTWTGTLYNCIVYFDRR